MEVTDEEIRHFRKFLKENNLYIDYLNCLVRQKYHSLHNDVGLIPNLKKLMERSTHHEEFGVMCFTLDAFTWVLGGYNIPKEFTQKWCTASFKWGLYCIEHNLEICTMRRFIELMDYWNMNGWIDKFMLSENEIKLIEELKRLQEWRHTLK